ncbi:hypothetical protein R5R35_012042 [Gryllus longicercus]
MGFIGKFLVFGAGLALLVGAGIGGLWYKLSQPAPIPKLELQYWGPGKAKADDITIKPFKINVSNEVLEDLRDRLDLLPPLTPPLEGANFRYGFNSDYLQKVVQFWQNEYDWRSRETFLNSLPQFSTQVGGLQLHFIHAKPREVPAGVRVLPLLLLHGWPGSVREFYELIPLLTAARPGAGFVFEVVAPSLPGFGFSEGAAKPGLGPAQMGVLFRALMERLGHKEFYVQGGDWGHVIGSAMATLFPKSVLGFHTNMVFLTTPLSQFRLLLGSFIPSLVVEPEHYNKVYPIVKNFMYILEESGYFHLQTTKPDTVGVSLRDSAVGLAAYILEKFSTWTDKDWRSLPDGNLEKKFSLTNLLDNVMIYWVSGSITTSMRLYSEAFTKQYLGLQIDSVPCIVPTAVANFPNELSYTPKKIAEDKYRNLVQFSHLPRGGHFAAFEEPQLLANDLWDAVENIRKIRFQSLSKIKK